MLKTISTKQKNGKQTQTNVYEMLFASVGSTSKSFGWLTNLVSHMQTRGLFSKITARWQ